MIRIFSNIVDFFTGVDMKDKFSFFDITKRSLVQSKVLGDSDEDVFRVYGYYPNRKQRRRHEKGKNFYTILEDEIIEQTVYFNDFWPMKEETANANLDADPDPHNWHHKQFLIFGDRGIMRDPMSTVYVENSGIKKIKEKKDCPSTIAGVREKNSVGGYQPEKPNGKLKNPPKEE